MGVVQRLNQFIELKGISKYKFYQKTGLSNGALDKGDNLGSDKCEKIYYTFPEINLVWLLTGQGDMLINDRPSTPVEMVINGEVVQSDDSAESSVYYKLYKEEKAENKALIKEIGALEQQVKTLEKQLEDLGFGEIKQQEASVGSARTRKTGAAELGSARFAEQP